MILGELYYYEKVLDELRIPLDLSKSIDIDLSGISVINTKDLRHLNEIEARRYVRDVFAMSYGKVLSENKLVSACKFWEALVSPKKSKTDTHFESEFMESLFKWLNKGGQASSLSILLKDGKYSTNESDFALYYGLKVLLKLSNLPQSLSDDLELRNNYKSSLLEAVAHDTKPQIIVLTQDFFSPLFINLNCVYSPIVEDKEVTLRNIDKELLQHSEIKMVLVNSPDLELIKYLKKHLPSDIIVSTFELENHQTQNFFDRITKKTLGIKLTSEE
ncbi:MAG: hypothetical protein AAGF07_03450 [Patescibacteria group bacterium]